MPTHKQNTVEVPATTFGRGSSETKDLQDIFPGSPIHSGELNDEVVQEQGNELLIEGSVNDGGHTFGTFDRDYPEAPNLEDVKTGGGGLPGTPYAPNIGAPPEGMNPADIPAKGAEVTERIQGGGDPFPGDGLASPSKTAKNIAAQKIGSLIFGESKVRE